MTLMKVYCISHLLGRPGFMVQDLAEKRGKPGTRLPDFPRYLFSPLPQGVQMLHA